MKTLRHGFCGALLLAALVPCIAGAAQAPPASRPADVAATLARHGIQPHATPMRATSGWRVPPKVLLLQISQRSINLERFRAAAPGVEVIVANDMGTALAAAADVDAIIGHNPEVCDARLIASARQLR